MEATTIEPRSDEEPQLKSQSEKPENRQHHRDSATSVAIWIIALGVVFYGLYSARAVMFPLTLSFFIAFPMRPLMRLLQRWKLPKFLAASLLLGSLVFGGVVLAMTLATPAGEWLKDSPSKIRKAELKLRNLSERLEDITQATKQVESLAETDGGTVKVQVQQPRLTSTLLTKTGDAAMGAVICTGMVFLLLIFGDDLIESIVSILPSRRDKEQLHDLFLDVERTISHYLLSYSVINAGLGTVIAVGLWAIGMPQAALWGVMAAILNFIPFLGLIAGTAVVGVAAILAFDSLAYASLAPLVYLIANGIEANFITPMILGRAMKLSSIVIFASIVVFGWIWGIGGAIIAVPALAVGKIVCNRVERLQLFCTILSGQSDVRRRSTFLLDTNSSG